MLRPKPTCIALAEDDVCYHLESILKRKDQFTKWYRQSAGSGSSYDGDDDDGLFLDSDTLSLPESLFESDCDDSRSPPLGNDDTQENRTGQGEDEGTDRDRDRIQDFQAIVRVERDLAKNTIGVLLLGIPSNPSSRLLGQMFTPQQCTHLFAHSLNHHPAALFPLRLAIFSNTLERVFSSVIPVPLQLGEEEILPIPQAESYHKALFLLSAQELPPVINPRQHAPSHLPRIKLIPWKASHLTNNMEHAGQDGPASSSRDSHGLGPNEINALLEATQNHSDARQPSPPQTIDPRSIERRSNTPKEAPKSRAKKGKARATSDDANTKNGGPKNTVSRATQTDPDMGTHVQANGDMRNPLQGQENIAPGGGASPPPQQLWQDVFMSAMFPEQTAPRYDPSGQARRSMVRIDNPPARRGRVARPQQGMAGQLVHPTMVDATVFQEYVHQLIAELDRAP
ncbi:hypothetical protein ASPCAL10672 [Aspergillus calidoustus]|uniref:Uncharacterized protein n=1 Tax=Aspergillus calidoustus TaxID=454130 RepID=A0A0U5G7E6_ASPCI|nr:hypothetical protein ASPCAL10672 [Aspergillus calidoustus]